MSYCRWSCDNFKSDVYVYESADGWMTHIAASKLEGDAPFPEYLEVVGKMDAIEWSRRYQERSAWMENAKRVSIKLKYAGMSFTDGSPQQCAVRLMMLKDIGYHVPDGVIETLQAEHVAMI